MSETDLAETPPEDKTPATEPEKPDAPQAQADAAPDFEDRALSMGWTPKGQFKGDPEKWVDAETFVRRGEEFLPFLKANNRRLEKELERSNAKFTKLEQTMERFAEHHTKTEQRAYDRAVRDIQARLDDAAERGDVQGVRNATDELVDLTKEAAGPKPDAKPAEPKEPEELSDWKAENPWFAKDAAMRGAAIEIVNELIRDGETDLGKQLAEVSRRIKAEFPHKFENPHRKLPGSVEAGAGQLRRGGKTFNDLPADAKAMCLEFERDIKGFKREQYVKDYFG